MQAALSGKVTEISQKLEEATEGNAETQKKYDELNQESCNTLHLTTTMQPACLHCDAMLA